MTAHWQGWKKHLGRGLTALGGLSLAACAAQEPPAVVSAQTVRPAMWTLSDADTKIYLLGTFHLLPADFAWRTPAIDGALKDADELVLEIVAPENPAAMAGPMMRMGMAPNLPPLAERVPAEKRAALTAMIAESGVPAAVFDRLETWAGAFALLGVTFKRLGLDPESGVESRLTASHKKSGKPVSGLETIQQQLGFFDTLSEESQRAFLAGMLDDPANAKKEFAEMLKAWSSGDVAAMDRIFNEDVSMSAELRDKLLKQRNIRWAEWLHKRLDKPGTVLVAVGAGHLAGADSVQNQLKARGLKTKRLQ